MGETAEVSPAPSAEVSRHLSRPICELCQFLRGSIAGTTAKTIVYPLDRLKITLQVRSAYSGEVFSVRRIPRELNRFIQTEGFLSLWKGNSSAICRIFPHSGIVYFSFDHYLEALQRWNENNAKINRLCAGAAAGATSTIITYPLDVLNTRMSVTKHQLSYKQVSLIYNEGLLSLYRGFIISFIGIIPYASVSFFTYESLKQYYKERKGEINSINTLLIGGISGIIGQTFVYPIDSIRKIKQIGTLFHVYQESPRVYDINEWGLMDCLRCIYSKGGINNLYKGVSICWIKGFIAAGISFLFNETLKKYINNNYICSI